MKKIKKLKGGGTLFINDDETLLCAHSSRNTVYVHDLTTKKMMSQHKTVRLRKTPREKLSFLTLKRARALVSTAWLTPRASLWYLPLTAPLCLISIGQVEQCFGLCQA